MTKTETLRTMLIKAKLARQLLIIADGKPGDTGTIESLSEWTLTLRLQAGGIMYIPVEEIINVQPAG